MIILNEFDGISCRKFSRCNVLLLKIFVKGDGDAGGSCGNTGGVGQPSRGEDSNGGQAGNNVVTCLNSVRRFYFCP